MDFFDSIELGLKIHDYDQVSQPDGSILLIKKKTAKPLSQLDSEPMTNTFRADTDETWRDDAREAVEAEMYRLENAWRSDSDPLKYKPESKPETSNLDTAYQEYLEVSQNAFRF